MNKPRINNQIRSKEIRVIDETGNQLGILNLDQALDMAKQKGLDLIQVTEKVEPPVCRIMDYGKFLYHLKKKEKSSHSHQKGGEMKAIRLTFGISEHDLEVRAKLAEKFLKIGDKVRIEMRLRGREKAHFDFAREKFNKFLEIVKRFVPIKAEGQIKREPRGLTMIISYDKKQETKLQER